MTGILVVSHGGLANGLVDSAFRILGEKVDGVHPVCIDWGLESQEAGQLIAAGIKEMKKKRERILILTDLFGGTPTNLAMTFYEPGEIEILTGVNLPMLIKAIMTVKKETGLADLVGMLREKGQKAIVSVSEAMESEARGEE